MTTMTMPTSPYFRGPQKKKKKGYPEQHAHQFPQNSFINTPEKDLTAMSSAEQADLVVETAMIANSTATVLKLALEGLYILIEERQRKQMDLLLSLDQHPDAFDVLVANEMSFDTNVTQKLPLLVEKCKQLMHRTDELVLKAKRFSE
jgi:hypothetical protein